MSGLFSTFNVAKRGMSVQQKSIDVSTHNIANANTEGYSRQRAEIETTRPYGMPSLNSAKEPGQIGTGSQISTIQRVRDTFLDYQVRVETSTQGKYEARDEFLSEIESIFNEPSDTGLSTLIGKFFDSWQQLSKQPQSSNARTVVAQQSAALADELNHTYTQLEKLKENSQLVIKDAIFEVNNVLDQIDRLNQQIIGVKVAGNEPNDLLDRRDLLLDDLSSMFNIELEKSDFYGINLLPVDKIKSSDINSNSYMVKAEVNSDVRRVSYVNDITQVSEDTYDITYFKYGDMLNDKNAVTIRVTNMDETAAKELEESRMLWADKAGNAILSNGEAIKSSESGNTIPFSQLQMFEPSSGMLSGYTSVEKDINDYMDQLNKLAKSVALSVNAVHSGQASASNLNKDKFPVEGDFMPFFVNKAIADYDSEHKMKNLNDILLGESEITAKNISVNEEIMYDVMKIKTRTNDDKFAYAENNTIDGETDGERALAIAGLRNNLIKVQEINSDIIKREDMFNPAKGGNMLLNNGLGIESNINGMTLDNYFKDTIDRLGIQTQEAKRMVKNQESLLASFQERKESISGVSLDEEMANMIQFQHAYQANAKIIATVDELLDVVVNGLKR